MSDLRASQMDYCVRKADVLQYTAGPTWPTVTPIPSSIVKDTDAPTFENEEAADNAPLFAPWSGPPTFEFKGPPLSMAPTTENWAYLLNNTEPRPIKFVGNNGDFDAPYPLGPCQSDCDTDEDVSYWLL